MGCSAHDFSNPKVNTTEGLDVIGIPHVFLKTFEHCDKITVTVSGFNRRSILNIEGLEGFWVTHFITGCLAAVSGEWLLFVRILFWHCLLMKLSRSFCLTSNFLSSSLKYFAPDMLGSSPDLLFPKTRGTSIISFFCQLEIYIKCHLLINHLETVLEEPQHRGGI